jgi:hypothetical protein
MTFDKALKIKQKLIQTEYHIKTDCDILVTSAGAIL